MLAGMGGVSMAPLVAAVSNAGGLGVMGAANLSPDDLRAEIRKTQALTKKPFAVDLLAPLPQMIVPYLPVLFDEEVTIFVAGLAVPEKHVAEMKRARHEDHGDDRARSRTRPRRRQAGADVVAAQGTEAGGHTGEIGTLALVPQVVDAVKIPVVAAGGIVDGRGVVAALALGAQGAIIGTRFIATPEATAAPAVSRGDRARPSRTRRSARAATPGSRSARSGTPTSSKHEADPTKMQALPRAADDLHAARRDGVLGPDADPDGRACRPGRASARFRGIKPAADVLREIVEGAARVLENGPFARG